MTYLPFLPTGAISGPKVSLPVVIDIVVHQSVIEPLCRSLVRTGNREVHGDTVRVFSSNMQMWATLRPRVVQGRQLLACCYAHAFRDCREGLQEKING